jgi:hypothetical protein
VDYKFVKSSSIDRVGYDPETKTLDVIFNNGKTYRYDGVHPDMHREMLRAESVGKYFHSNIRNVFQTKLVETPKAQGA